MTRPSSTIMTATVSNESASCLACCNFSDDQPSSSGVSTFSQVLPGYRFRPLSLLLITFAPLPGVTCWLVAWRAISAAGSRATRSSLGASRNFPAKYKNATGAAPTPKTSANNPTVSKAYLLNRRQGVLRGFFNGRSIKCSYVDRRQEAVKSGSLFCYLPTA